MLTSLGGATFGNGLYRLHDPRDINTWNSIVTEAFPEFSRRVWCFGYDWQGSQFALDAARRDPRSSEPLVLLFEPGTGEALEIPATFHSFHESELVHNADAALTTTFFEKWARTPGARPLRANECVGLKTPLFLGGIDDVENLEITDLEVYWGISSQLLEQTRGLPPGTQIGQVTIR